MFRLYAKVAAETGRRLLRSWPVLLVLPVYALILYAAAFVAGAAGILGGIFMSFVIAACWSSYLELISQAVSSGRFRLDVDEFKRTFGAHFWDVVSVLFVFWLIGLLTAPLTQASANGHAIAAIIGLGMAFFFNVVPELLYQGNSRSFALLMDSARFMTEHPVIWLLPNVFVALLVLVLSGGLDLSQPVTILIFLGNTFSSPIAVLATLLSSFPVWAIPLVMTAAHAMMIFRGLLFKEISSGAANPRLQAWRARSGG